MYEARINSALRKLADSFLNDLRQTGSSGSLAGWGQFVGQRAGTQVGLYGTCAGVVTIALAYGDDRIPQQAIDYLAELWEQRNSVGTEGPRYFALTNRLAFFLLALHQAHIKAFTKILPEADSALRDRLLQDGMIRSWQIDGTRRSLTGDEFSTAMSILAHSLAASSKGDIPPEIRRAAEALQARIEGSPPVNVGVRKFCLAAVTTALDEQFVAHKLHRMVRSNIPGEHNRDQDSLYFWDYWFRGPSGETSRRDYFHVPSNALDVLLAFGSTAGRSQRAAARELAAHDVDTILETGLYYAGRELATSNNQAWLALALSKTKTSIASDSSSGFAKRVRNYFWGERT